jgi:hypothetical protein
MMHRYVDGEPAAALLERRWFAAFKAASDTRAECEALLETLAITQSAWSRARARLSELEVLRDALEEDLDALVGCEEATLAEDSTILMSAA